MRPACNARFPVLFPPRCTYAIKDFDDNWDKWGTWQIEAYLRERYRVEDGMLITTYIGMYTAYSFGSHANLYDEGERARIPRGGEKRKNAGEAL